MSSAPEDLRQAFAEWRRLADAEGQAIRAGNWLLVSECQKALATLRSRIDRLNVCGGAVTAQRGSETRPAGTDLRGTVLELIELQRRNLTSLEDRRRRLSAYVENLTSAGRNLRGIQRTYSTPAAGGFSSYS